MHTNSYPLHQLGWQAFQDLCVAIAEEHLNRPVQTFLPTNDAGRDGAFIGGWERETDGESTIQCKFTSTIGRNLTLSMLNDELAKAKRLAEKGLARDYIILTNHAVTGASELKIKTAFQGVGIERCRVFHRDWIESRIRHSPKLRMMVPRLYGLGDVRNFLDERAYGQAQLILSEMGDSLMKLVVTDAHRRSVRAISEYGFALLLGSPAAGKSTIGASLAIGAADRWRCSTIKSSSPEHMEKHIDPEGGQFFWVDDAWGSTQYQRNRAEEWNQILPLIQGAIKKGSKFLITSRDYIWKSAKGDLKTHSLPLLTKSQVIIDVHNLDENEKARILYNHIKFGDQSNRFRTQVKTFLPEIVKLNHFLPETARRFGNSMFTKDLLLRQDRIVDFFRRPTEFLEQTIESLSAEAKAAIALIFLNGGTVRSPVPAELLEPPSQAFGLDHQNKLRNELQSMNGSLLTLVRDEEGAYWTYRHPTVGDGFASFVAKSPELLEIYLRGAKAETIAQEVVCSGISFPGAHVIVPNSLHNLLLDRLKILPLHSISAFLSYRSNPSFSEKMIELRPDVLERLNTFFPPLKEDLDVDLVITLHKQGLLPEQYRGVFVDSVRECALEFVDASILEYKGIADVLTKLELETILQEAQEVIFSDVDRYVDQVRADWSSDYDPNDFFEELISALTAFATCGEADDLRQQKLDQAKQSIALHVASMEEEYHSDDPDTTEPLPEPPLEGSLGEIFRDIDE